MKSKVVICWGRFQIPSPGHKKVFAVASNLAQKQNADLRIYATHTQDAKKNPLSYREKNQFLRAAFPQYENNIIKTDLKTIFDVLRDLEKRGYKEVTLVVGSDRVKQFREMIEPYINSKHKDSLKFDSLNVVSAGKRDPDSEDEVEASSSSKLRELALKGDFKQFNSIIKSATQLTSEQVKQLYELIRERINSKLEENNMANSQNPSPMWQSFKNWFTIQDAKDPEIDEAAKKKKDDKRPASDYLVVDKDGKRHLPVKRNGKIDNRLLGAAHASLVKGFRGKKYAGPNKAAAMAKLRALYKKAGKEMPE